MPHDGLDLTSARLVAIVRFHDGGDLRGALEALTAGGIDIVEITLDTPGALAAVEEAAGDGRTVGVGTVLTAKQVRESAAAGARFVVSPGLVPDVVATALEHGLEPIPGAFTPTELIGALDAGARVVKVFPACSVGPAYVRALRGPFPSVGLVPTGGVGIDDIPAYLEAGASAVALGSELVGRKAPRTERDLERIRAQAARAIEAARA
jgi:2-dehydro-3-deoxyphosphogluconate aldolase/(4S)-4-hydroxy-2-oxoglutarate aldolase